MNIQDKVKALDVRIAMLKAKGETMNQRIINKCIRKRRALQAKL